MKYYKVVKDGVVDNTTGYSTVENELVTEKERIKKFSSLSDKCFLVVNVNKNNTYWFFGARFECK